MAGLDQFQRSCTHLDLNLLLQFPLALQLPLALLLQPRSDHFDVTPQLVAPRFDLLG